MEEKILRIRLIVASVIVFSILALAWYGLERSSRQAAPSLAGAASSTTATGYAYANATEDDIFISSPQPDAIVKSSVIVTGFARGPWYFEAAFPVVVTGAKGIVVGAGRGKAESDSMTSSFVPFTAEADFKAPYNGPATVTLKNDNPSGDKSRDKSVSFPVMVQ